MIQIDFHVSNEGALAARSEIKAFLRFTQDRMTGNNDNAALAYVILKTFSKRLDEELAKLEQRAREAERKGTPTVREERG